MKGRALLRETDATLRAMLAELSRASVNGLPRYTLVFILSYDR